MCKVCPRTPVNYVSGLYTPAQAGIPHPRPSQDPPRPLGEGWGEGSPYGIWRGLVPDERRYVVSGQPRPPTERREFDEDGDARDDRS